MCIYPVGDGQNEFYRYVYALSILKAEYEFEYILWLWFMLLFFVCAAVLFAVCAQAQ